MILLATIEQSFTVPGRGRLVLPATFTNPDITVRTGDAIQLRKPNSAVIDTRIVGVELAKQASGCRLALLLPLELESDDLAPGIEIWVKSRK